MPTDVRRYGPDEDLPDGVCPLCRSARPPQGRRTCQACSVVLSVTVDVSRETAPLDELAAEILDELGFHGLAEAVRRPRGRP